MLTNGVTTIGARGGNTINGAGVTLGGMVSPWIIDTTDNTFVGYNPMSSPVNSFGVATDTGFQPILTTLPAGVAAVGQIAYSKVVSIAAPASGAFGTTGPISRT